MKDNSYASNLKLNFIADWNVVAKSRKPIIAAVNGYAVSNAFDCLRLKTKMNNSITNIYSSFFIVGWRK